MTPHTITFNDTDVRRSHARAAQRALREADRDTDVPADDADPSPST